MATGVHVKHAHSDLQARTGYARVVNPELSLHRPEQTAAPVDLASIKRHHTVTCRQLRQEHQSLAARRSRHFMDFMLRTNSSTGSMTSVVGLSAASRAVRSHVLRSLRWWNQRVCTPYAFRAGTSCLLFTSLAWHCTIQKTQLQAWMENGGQLSRLSSMSPSIMDRSKGTASTTTVTGRSRLPSSSGLEAMGPTLPGVLTTGQDSAMASIRTMLS